MLFSCNNYDDKWMKKEDLLASMGSSTEKSYYSKKGSFKMRHNRVNLWISDNYPSFSYNIFLFLLVKSLNYNSTNQIM